MKRSSSHCRTTAAFSLIELSIVLVIVGLLAGGILAGKSLVRNSELRAVTAEYQRYSTAVTGFHDKYAFYPGDFKNAEAYWGTDTNCGGTYAGTTPTAGTCNGNGDGVMDWATGVSATGEIFQFWKQLALAGLIQGGYTGFSGPTTGQLGADHVFEVNAPPSRLPDSGWGIINVGDYVGDPVQAYALNYGNTFVFGGLNPGGMPYKMVLRPKEAWSIDKKLDDGMPGTGTVIARYLSPYCSTAANVNDLSAPYNLTNTLVSCTLYFVREL